jgi:hypothetical protein
MKKVMTAAFALSALFSPGSDFVFRVTVKGAGYRWRPREPDASGCGTRRTAPLGLRVLH